MESKVYCMDCMEAMRQMPNKCFDLAIVDPPYFHGPEKRGYYGSRISKTGVHRDYPISPAWEIPGAEYFTELARVAKKYIIWGCNYYNVSLPCGRIVWDKCNGKSSFSDCEIAATNCHNSVRLVRYLWNGMFQGRSVAEGHIQQADKSKNEKRIHPTQKPVALYVWLLQQYAKPGDKILDTHLGSGSSRIAAYDLGFDFLGIEIDATCFLAQEERFADHTAQQSLYRA